MGVSSTHEEKETAMAEPWLSTVEKLTEFFSADQIEASARRTKFVQRASKVTGKLFLALVTFGRWSAPKTTLAQLAAKAAQVEHPGDVTPEALACISKNWQVRGKAGSVQEKADKNSMNST